jgi:NAD(P)-dependent dehydrogenase (short-subunit alcohol dehydrogenase family)
LAKTRSSRTVAKPKAVEKFGGVDLLVNNAAHQASVKSIQDISGEEWDMTFRTISIQCFI